MINKKIKTIAAIVVAVGIIAVGMGGAVHAATNNNGQPNFMTGLANAIAQRFNLNLSDVQQVVDDQMTQHKAQVQADNQLAFTDRINKAVADGKLTQEQADKIIAKKASVDLEIAALKGKTKEEIKTGIKSIRDSVKQWMTDNNIPRQYFMVGFNGGLREMHGKGGMMGSFNGQEKD